MPSLSMYLSSCLHFIVVKHSHVFQASLLCAESNSDVLGIPNDSIQMRNLASETDRYAFELWPTSRCTILRALLQIWNLKFPCIGQGDHPALLGRLRS